MFPLQRDLPADFIPVLPNQGVAHAGGDVANPLEMVEDVPVAVDVPLGHLPIIDSRLTGGARVRQYDSPLELGRIEVERHTTDAVDARSSTAETPPYKAGR